MDRLTQLLSDLDGIDQSLDALLAHDDLTADQKAEHDRLVAARAAKVAAVSREQASLARAEERERLAADAEKSRRTVGAGRRTDTDGPANGVNAGRGPRVEVKETDYKAIRDAKGRCTYGFRTPREYMQSVMAAGQGRPADPRLATLWQGGRQAAAGSDEARGNYDSSVGFLVPESFSPDFLFLEPENDPCGPYTTKIPMGNPIVRIPARTDKDHTTSVSGGLTVTRKPETVAGTPSQQTMEQITLEAHNLFGLSYATEEILVDSPISFIAILEKGFKDQFVYQLINERINGTGVGEFEGILNTPSLVSVTKETGQAAKTIVYENVLKMMSQCWGYGNARWLANHDCLPQLGLLNQQVGTAGTGMIWQASAREGSPNLLLGRPVEFTEYTQTLGTVGDILLVNWGEYLEGTYQPMESAESMHVRFVNHERAFKFWTRNAGRCWWKTALTPKNSSSKLSPFVALATRS